jgi:sec-independent protein translocase protein TatA
MGELSWWHWLIVIAALVLLFGANKLPTMARSLGQSVRILRSETRAMNDEPKDQKKGSNSEQRSVEQSEHDSASVPGTQAQTSKAESEKPEAS